MSHRRNRNGCEEILKEYDSFPKKCEFNLNGTKKTAEILSLYK